MTESKRRMVVALGGNALGNDPQEQLRLIRHTAKPLADLVEQGIEVLITHGNGPQVGSIKVATDVAAQTGSSPEFPFAECGAMSQGYIGYHLAQALDNEFTARGMDKNSFSLVTQTVVDGNDPAFENPTKPVGAMLTKEQADAKHDETGDIYVEDSGRGWRRVVASPKPIEILESKVISQSLSAGSVVIASGGGGIPVVRDENGLHGVSAVIDKDRSAALLARQIDADTLLILTAVEKVAINFNKPDQTDLDHMTVKEAEEYIEQGQFAPGSMLPKVEACIEFVKNSNGGKAIITSLDKADKVFSEGAGTTITL